MPETTTSTAAVCGTASGRTSVRRASWSNTGGVIAERRSMIAGRGEQHGADPSDPVAALDVGA